MWITLLQGRSHHETTTDVTCVLGVRIDWKGRQPRMCTLRRDVPVHARGRGEHPDVLLLRRHRPFACGRGVCVGDGLDTTWRLSSMASRACASVRGSTVAGKTSLATRPDRTSCVSAPCHTRSPAAVWGLGWQVYTPHCALCLFHRVSFPESTFWPSARGAR